MKNRILIIAILALFSFLIGFSQEKQQPNILFIAVDDLKPTIGAFGDAFAITPNMDKLAESATVFLNNHAQQPVCGPSRASLMTGRRPDVTKVRDLKTKMRDINPDIITIPQYFKEQGYTTLGTGKIFDPRCVDKELDAPSWSVPFNKTDQLTYPEGVQAPAMGYYQNPEILAEIDRLKEEAKQKGQNPSKYSRERFKPPYERSNVVDEAYIDGAIKVNALEMIDQVAKTPEQPFFLAVGFKRPHLPFVAPQKYWDMYKKEDIQLAPFQQKAKNGTNLTYHNSGELRSYVTPDIEYKINDDNLLELAPEVQRELIHGYYACVSFVDKQIGDILNKLEEKNLRENTIIVIWGDHGWHLGDHSMWNKHSPLEQATRSPLMIVTPNSNELIQVSSPTEFVDIFPTLCELAGLEVPNSLEGKSLKPIMDKVIPAVKNYAVTQQPRGKTTGYSFRSEFHRYTIWVANKKSTEKITSEDIVAEELYDYQNDPLETVNQIDNEAYGYVKRTMRTYARAFFNESRLGKKLAKVDTGTPIKELVKKEFPNGNVTVGATIGISTMTGPVTELFLKDFDYATSRNFAKQSRVHPKPGLWKWDKVDEFLALAKLHDFKVRLHSPISPQASKWAKEDHRTPKELSKIMKEYMTELCKKVNDIEEVVWMDVVNETVERDGNWFKEKPGTDKWENPWHQIGENEDGIPTYIIDAFEIASKHAPNKSLVFNQHGAMEPAMWEKVKETVLYLKGKGYQVDGLGWQGHLKENSRVVNDPKNLEYLSNLIDWAHENDLDFHITEFDYHLKKDENTEENFRLQAEAYEKILKVLWSKSNSGVVTFNAWGISDADDGQNLHRFLYDEDLQPKPAYFALKASLKKEKN